MKTLPNGVTVYNATPHSITFWKDGWEEPVTVPPDTPINASPKEEIVEVRGAVTFVKTIFVGTDEGRRIAEEAKAAGADVVIGSIIAAQAYPGLVVAMLPAPGFERVPPEQKRMLPDKFTVY